MKTLILNLVGCNGNESPKYNGMVKRYIQDNKDRFLSELFAFLRIPSVSAVKAHEKDVVAAADYVCKRLKEAGATAAEIYETEGHPIVYGERKTEDTLPTVLVYGHYDVQPPDPLNLWDSPPFEPVIRDNKIFARGASDDKGQVYMHIKAMETMVHLKSLPCHLKFIIEGEEEVGSANLEKFIINNKERLKADVVLVSDTSIISMNQPSIPVGLRGLSYVEVEVTGPNRDLHSGLYGGAVANPIHVLCDMIHALIDDNGRIMIPGFYDTVRKLNDEERTALGSTPFDLEEYKKDLGIDKEHGEKGYTTLERTGIRPALDVNGIWGGYVGEGAKTILPSKACAKISLRLTPNQSSEEMTHLLTNHLMSIAPPFVKVKVKELQGGDPILMPTDSVACKASMQAFEKIWGVSPIYTYSGGSIPVVPLFKKELELYTVLMGFGLDSDAIHSPNEHYGVNNFLLGIETIVAFHQYFSQHFKKSV